MRNEKGFSLIELLSVIALIGLCCIIAIPSYQFLITKYQSTATINNLVAAISFTRASAIRYGQNVILCPSRSGKFCDGADFNDQMIILLNPDEKNMSGVLLHVFHKISGGRLVWNRKQNFVMFDRMGFLQSQNGVFCYFSREEKVCGKQVILSKTGRTRVLK